VAHGDQDVRAPALAAAGGPQRPRVRRDRSPAQEADCVKKDNCFTEIADPQGLARVADALSQPAAIACRGQACEQRIYTACLCFGLDTGEQQQASGFRFG
jgi:hypothetical protein